MRSREIGENLGLDFSYHITPDGTRFLLLNLIDEASKFHVAKIVRSARVKAHSDLGNCDAVDLIDCLQEYTRYLPSPKVIHCDDEGVFSSDEFKEWCNQRSIHIRPCAGEAHWQNGIVERRIGTLKQIVQRLFLDDLYAGLDPEYILDKACESKNVNGSYGGYAPIQWFHGTKKHPLIDSEAVPLLYKLGLNLKNT